MSLRWVFGFYNALIKLIDRFVGCVGSEGRRKDSTQEWLYVLEQSRRLSGQWTTSKEWQNHSTLV